MISKVYAIVTLSAKVAPFEVMIVGKKIIAERNGQSTRNSG
jgi:hypothetical protein